MKNLFIIFFMLINLAPISSADLNQTDLNINPIRLRKRPDPKIFFLNGRSNINQMSTVKSTKATANLFKVEEEIKILTDSYKLCISKLSLNDFSDSTIQSCTGSDFEFIKNDVSFIEMKALAQLERKIRQIFIEQCYKVVRGNQLKSRTCDILETDVLDFLWNDADFSALIAKNKTKYTFEYGTLSNEVIDAITGDLYGLYSGLKDLRDEIDTSLDNGLDELKTLIEDRYKKSVDPQYRKSVIHLETVVNPRDYIMEAAQKIDG